MKLTDSKVYIGELLLERVPEYANVYRSKEDLDRFELGSFFFLNEFATELARRVENEGNSDFVNQSLSFINEVGDNDNSSILNLLDIGVLEILYTSGTRVRDSILPLLNTRNKEAFLRFSKLYS